MDKELPVNQTSKSSVFRKRVLPLFIFLVIIGGLVATLIAIRKTRELRSKAAGGQTWTVCPQAGTGCDYADSVGIQQAIDAAADGDTILIKSGQYTNVNVHIGISYGGVNHPAHHNLQISGEGAGAITTMLSGDGSNPVFYIQDSSVWIQRLAIRNGSLGIDIRASQVTALANIIADNPGAGIEVFSGGTLDSENNIILGHGDGPGLIMNDNVATSQVRNTVFFDNMNGDTQWNAISIQHWPATPVLVLDLYDNIFSKGAYGIFKDPSAGLTLNAGANLFDGQTTGCASDTSWCTTNGSLNGVDPMFVGMGDHDFHLRSASPAINVGYPPDPSVKDPDGSAVDIGAYGGPGACLLDPALPGCGGGASPTPVPTEAGATPTPAPACTAQSTQSFTDVLNAIDPQDAWTQPFPSSADADARYVQTNGVLRENVFKGDRYWGIECPTFDQAQEKYTGCFAKVDKSLTQMTTGMTWSTQFPVNGPLHGVSQYVYENDAHSPNHILRGNFFGKDEDNIERYWAWECGMSPDGTVSGCDAVVTKTLDEMKGGIDQTVWNDAGHPLPTDTVDAVSQYMNSDYTTLQSNVFKGDRYWGYQCTIDPATGATSDCHAVATKSLTEMSGSIGGQEVWNPAFPTDAFDDAAAYYQPDITLRGTVFKGSQLWNYLCRPVSPTPTPEPTVIPSLTPVPSSTPTPPPGANVLNFKIRLEGIATQRPDETFAVTLKLDEQVVNTYHVGGISDANGVYSATIAGYAPGTYDVFVKGISHLQRKFPGIVLGAGTSTQDWTSQNQALWVGDVNGTNSITIDDISAVLSKYTDFSIPVPAGTPEDVNNDQLITIEDVALSLVHYTDLEIKGDE